MPPEQQVLLLGELIALIAAAAFLIRSWGETLESRAKAQALQAEADCEREAADTHTRELVNRITQTQAEEIQALRVEVTALKVENVALKVREEHEDKRYAQMQARIDSLVESVTELKLKLSLAEVTAAKVQAELEAKTAQVTELQKLLEDCQNSKVDYTS